MGVCSAGRGDVVAGGVEERFEPWRKALRPGAMRVRLAWNEVSMSEARRPVPPEIRLSKPRPNTGFSTETDWKTFPEAAIKTWNRKFSKESISRDGRGSMAGCRWFQQT